MAIRDLPTTDGLPTCEVETAQELTARLVPGVYVRAAREVLAACGWGDTENADTAEIPTGNRTMLAPFGGFRPAVDRLKALRQLPEGRPTRTTARGAIDRFKFWSTVRLTTPEAAT